MIQNQYGMSWIKNWVTDRSQTIIVNGKLSLSISREVPQDWVLDFAQFNILISDLKGAKSLLIMYR